MLNVSDIRQHFIDELKAERFTTDKTGEQTIEMIGASFIADEPAIFGTPNQDYINAEIDWYVNQSTNVKDIYRGTKQAPSAWTYAASKHGEINSNYGHLIYSKKYYDGDTRVKKWAPGVTEKKYKANPDLDSLFLVEVELNFSPPKGGRAVTYYYKPKFTKDSKIDVKLIEVVDIF